MTIKSPIIYWPRRYRWTLGPLVWLFIMVPLTVAGIAYEVGKTLFEVIVDLSELISEAITLLAIGIVAIILGAPKKRGPRK